MTPHVQCIDGVACGVELSDEAVMRVDISFSILAEAVLQYYTGPSRCFSGTPNVHC